MHVTWIATLLFIQRTQLDDEAFLYPSLERLLWYVLARYVLVLLGRNHLKEPLPDDELNSAKKKKVQDRHLTQAELAGVRAVHVHLLSLQRRRKTRPPFVKNVVGLFKRVDLLLDEHEDDDQVLAVDGRPVLLWPNEQSPALGDDERLEEKSPVLSVREKNCRDPRKSSTGDDDKENDGLPESALKNSKAAFFSQLARKRPKKKVQQQTPRLVLEEEEEHFECSPKTRQLTIPEMITSGAKRERHDVDDWKSSPSIATLPPPDETIYDFSDETDEKRDRGRGKRIFRFKKLAASTPTSLEPSTSAAFGALGDKRDAGETSSTTAYLAAFDGFLENSQKSSSSSQRAAEASTCGPKFNVKEPSMEKKRSSTLSEQSFGGAKKMLKVRCSKCVNCLKLRDCGRCEGCFRGGSTTTKVRVDLFLLQC
jgi:hypothetical protein